MKKKIILIAAIVVCIFAVIAAVFGYRMIQQKQQVRELLELGNQYLQEEQYEEAIAAYRQLLAIEPKEETARENIVVAAVAWSDDLIEEKEYDKAEDVIADVYSIVPDERLERKRQEIIDIQEAYEQELLEIKKKEEERKQAVEQINADLSELAQICASGEDDAVFTYLASDAFQTLIQSEYIEFDKKYETEFGTLGLYNKGAFLYFGDYDGEIRSGNGAWYATEVGDMSGYVAHGEWSNDKPNGKQFARWPISHQMTGSVTDGLWDGGADISFDASMSGVPGTSIQSYSVNYHSGIAEVIQVLDNGAEIIGIDSSNGTMFGREDNTVPGGILGFCKMPL